MKSYRFKALGLVLIVIFLFSFSSKSQNTRQPTTQTSMRKISTADKMALIEMFKKVDPKFYRLEFNGGREVYGTKKISMDEIVQVRKERNPLDEKGIVTFVARDQGVLYIYNVTKIIHDLQTILGKENAVKLKTIMAKYYVQE